MKSLGKKYILYAIYTLLASGLLYGLLQLILSGYAVTWTGFQTKTLWDWMELLIIPLVLALGAFFLNRSERAIERENTNKRTELEIEIAKDRQQEAAFQSYIDRISGLLIENRLLTTELREVRDVARTLTIAVLRILNRERSNLVLQFLREAGLVTDQSSILNKADMEGMNLQGLDFRKVHLQGANLRYVNLQNAWLTDVNLQGADLTNADLQKTHLTRADLQKAEFNGANLQETDMQEAKLQGAILVLAKMRKANLFKADLSSASLLFADLKMAWLNNANLQEAELEKSELNEATIDEANLKDAKVTLEQLAQAKSLKGATMPDGTVHE